MNLPELKNLKKEIQTKYENIPKVLFNPTFDLIFELVDCNEILINIPKYSIYNHKATLIKNIKGFTIEIEGVKCNMEETYDIELLIGKNVFVVKNFSISKSSTKLERNGENKLFSVKLLSSGNIPQFAPKSKSNNNTYCRFVIPVEKSQINYYIDTKRFQDELFIYAFGKLSFSVDKNRLVLYEQKFRDKYYFVIDSVKPININLFSDICHSVMIGYGFLSADFHQNEAFYLKSEHSNFESIIEISYLQLRPSIISHGTCNPIYSNPYGYSCDEKIIEKIGKQLEVFDSYLFSRLCTKLFKDSEYATLILIILESNISSLILRPAGYSVALEKITNIIVEENKGLKPIPDKSLSIEFRCKLIEVLESFKEKIDRIGNNDSMKILQKNIDRINSPTNRDKLTKPFEIYKIVLTDKDINAIDNRNNFLHGRNIKIEEGSNEFLEIYQISLRLNKILNKLILKHIGYSGFMINHLKQNENSFDYKIEEELFEKI